MKSLAKKLPCSVLSTLVVPSIFLLVSPNLKAADTAEHSFSGNIGITSNYVFRGVSQSQNEAALQGGIDYAHKSGVYLGSWASNVAWVNDSAIKRNSSLEIDFYGGYKATIFDEVNYDIGAIYYLYPGKLETNATEPNSAEVYAGISWNNLSFKYSHAVSKNLFAWGTSEQKTRGSNYSDLSYEYSLNQQIGLIAHIGKQNIRKFNDASYRDWKIGVSYALPAGKLIAAYTDTNAKDVIYTWNDQKVAKGLFALSYLYSF